MIWSAIDAIRRALQRPRKSVPRSQDQQAEPVESAKPPEASPEGGLGELEKQGLMGKFFRHWKDPAVLRQLKAVAARMQADGVNPRDRAAVQAWLKAHQKEIASGELVDAPSVAKPGTYVKTGPEVGRNDPCPCGSGKKHKKCCGAKLPA